MTNRNPPSLLRIALLTLYPTRSAKTIPSKQHIQQQTDCFIQKLPYCWIQSQQYEISLLMDIYGTVGLYTYYSRWE